MTFVAGLSAYPIFILILSLFEIIQFAKVEIKFHRPSSREAWQLTWFWPMEKKKTLNGISRKVIIFLIKGTDLAVFLPFSLPPAQNVDRMTRSGEEIL